MLEDLAELIRKDPSNKACILAVKRMIANRRSSKG